jgi:hypothetical protein
VPWACLALILITKSQSEPISMETASGTEPKFMTQKVHRSADGHGMSF